ncbi:hypothetical protein FOYG_17089 [Fusarium oxysporum NRRL 32931]|uniref:1-acylglycerone phosphate reductase n=1 Tax=Fusarium oxysporum NRRL 32931 TaxID=660029 RepID=W9HFN5_FUSOX|nr:hypothetical protein FOYG_17089 [Fusarium oxysporum NRRL 32931]
MDVKETVLITGCSDGGIGSALAIVFQQRGYHVFATTRDLTTMATLKSTPDITLLKLDVVDERDIAAAVDAVTAVTGGTLNYLINNARRNHFMPMLDEDIGALKRLYDVNVWGQLALTQAFAPLVIRAKGTITFTTSIAGHLNVPYMGSYAASKRSMEIMAETLRLEMAPFGVTVLCVVTGAVKTNGQSYFENLTLPENSFYKSIEAIVAKRAQGNDGVARMDVMDYAAAVVGTATKHIGGKFWCGENADNVRMAVSGQVPQSVTVCHR